MICALICLCGSGCLTVEQEIFLNKDGSGDLVLHVSMPDLPEDMIKQGSAVSGSGGGPDLEAMKKELTSELPPTVTLKQIKEARQNGALGFYVVLQFKDLKDVAGVLSKFGKEGLKESEPNGNSEWSVNLARSGGQNLFTSKFLLDMSDMMKGETKPEGGEKSTGKNKSAEKEKTKQEPTEANLDLSAQLAPLLMGMIRFKFVLHAPSPITETNADIVLNERTAVWNCSPIAFQKNKGKPIEMRAKY
jgi:hypothetical protein